MTMQIEPRDFGVPLQKVREVSCRTGISEFALRRGLRAGSIPHIRVGRDYLINVPALLRLLESGGIVI